MMLTSGSLIQGTFGTHGNFEVVLCRPLPGGSGEVRHYWREMDKPDREWKAAAVITYGATGPASLIQNSDRALDVIVPMQNCLGHFRTDPTTKLWQCVATFAYGATGPGALCRHRGHGNLEAVVLHGHHLVHHWRDAAGWHAGVVITDRAIGPASIIHNKNNNLEVLVLEGQRLVLYWRDEKNPQLPWRRGGVVSEQATGPAGFVQGPWGPFDHPNFEVVVPEGDHLRHYWRDHSQSALPWKPGAFVAWGQGRILAASLAATRVPAEDPNVVEDNLDALVQEDENNVFHYYRGPSMRWFRGSCLRVNEGEVLNAGTSQRVQQLTGQRDFVAQAERIRQPHTALSPVPLLKGAAQHGIKGTDLGASFQHGGRTYFLFGDTHWLDDRCEPTRDVIAVTASRDAAQGIDLQYHRCCMEVIGGDVKMCEYDVPLDGFSHQNEMYSFFTSNHFKERRVMYRSVLARCATRDPGREIQDSYQPNVPIPPPLVFNYLQDLSTERFINVSVALVNADEIRRWQLPATSRALLIWGTGAYRADVLMLACLPLDSAAPVLNLMRYFTGTKHGNPVWSPAGLQHERDAVALFHPAAIGELSVRWDAVLRRWVLMYCDGPEDPAGLSVTLRVSRTPWGPWSPRRIVLDWWRDAMERYIHRGSVNDYLNQDDTPYKRDIKEGGAAYAPYQLPQYTTGGPMIAIYYVLSTWNPYQAVLMRHTISPVELHRLDASYTALWERSDGIPWQVSHALSATEYKQKFDDLVEQGFRLTHMSGSETAGEALYAAIWEQREGPAWQARHGLTAREYQDVFNQMSDERYRLTHVHGYSVSGEPLFAAIWQQDGGPAQQAHHGMNASEYQRTFDELRDQGYRLTVVSGYEVDHEACYAAIWERRPGPVWHARHGLTEAEYESTCDALADKAFRLTFVTSYYVCTQMLYAGIWEQSDGPAWQSKHGLTELQYQRTSDDLVAAGFKLKFVNG